MIGSFVFRFVLFKRHYDKYVALAARYEEARGLAYYLEERYHEVKVRKKQTTRLKVDFLIIQIPPGKRHSPDFEKSRGRRINLKK